MFQTLKSIGQRRVLFLELKIKDHVVHAGHLLQLLHANHGLYLRKKQLIFQNSNLLTVQDHMELMDATEDQDRLH